MERILTQGDVDYLVKLYKKQKDYWSLVAGYTRGFKNTDIGKNYELALKYAEIALNSEIDDDENWEKTQIVYCVIEIFNNTDYKEKISSDLLRLMLEYSDCYAKNGIAKMYLNGNGVNQDIKKCIMLLEINKNYNELGKMYRDGVGVEKNSEEAIKYFEMSKSYQQIGIMYRDGKGVEKNFEKAVEYFKKDIALGRKSCIKTLNTMLKKGQCTEKDIGEALEKFEASKIQKLENVINRKPKDDVELYERGLTYYKLKKYKQAIKDFDEVITITKTYYLDYEQDIAEVYHNRGLCYKALGRNAEAEKDFAKARELGFID